MPKLSVITVTYNAEKTLERTLRSVREQTFADNIEHIVVDGRSNDGTTTLIKQYERPALKWVSEPDQGLYDAMNKAAARASGDYLCFLNAGDTFFEAATVEKLFATLPEGELPGIIYGETAIVDNEGKFLHMRRLKAPEKLSWRSFRNGMVVCHQAFIANRTLFEPYDLKYRFSSDFDWTIRLMKKSARNHNTHLTLINYLNEGMTTTHRKASLMERYRIMVRHYGHISTLLHHIWFAVRLLGK